MKVRAKHWLKHSGTWYRGGQEFEAADAEIASLDGMIEIAEAPVSPKPEQTAEKTEEQATETAVKGRRGRPKKTEQ